MTVLPNGRNSAPSERAGAGKPPRYVGHTLQMRTSPAWRGLPDNARRIVFELEERHMKAGLTQNGALTCTYDEFVKAGIRRSSVRLAIEQAVALGFVEIVRRGYSARTDVRVPSVYRLTHVRSLGKDVKEPTDEWMAFKTDREVQGALRQVLAMLDEEREARSARKRKRNLLKDRSSPGHGATL